MRFTWMLGTTIVGLALLVTVGASVGQDKKDKSKGYLPPGWKDLNLTADQKDKIYKIKADNKAKFDELKDAENKLKASEKSEMAKVLTDAQKEQLKNLAVGETGKKKTDEKKTEDKK